MIDSNYCVTILIGSVTGFAYGLFFVHTQKRALSLQTYSSVSKSITHFIGNSLVRYALLGICGFYLLRLAIIHFILLIIAFVITFWLAIFNKKA
ncbi:MAG: hypothetical protein NT124_01030 [Candidatus Dependentiae bacterium]|nr:hypothetical protein [Candidatus Dependentiae bacterium]